MTIINPASLRGRARSAPDPRQIVGVSLELYRRNQNDPAVLPTDVPEGTDQPFRMNVTPLDRRDGEKLTFPYNPEEYGVSQSVNWSPHNASGAVRDGMRWNGNGPRQASFDLLLDDYHWPDGVRDGSNNGTRLEGLLKTLEQWYTQPSIGTQEPPLLYLQFGSQIFIGNITNLSIRRLRLDQYGDALVAEVRIEFTENDRSV